MHDELDQSVTITSVECPRCGYDQRGVISTWSESCPVHGVCSECGLAFEWSHLLNVELQRPRWCVEYAESRSGFVARVFKTMFVIHWPWKLWRELRMVDPPRWRRLVRMGLLLTLLWLPAWYVIDRGSAAWATHQLLTQQWRGTTTVSLAESVLSAAFMPLSNQSPGMVSFPLGPPTPYPSPSQIQSAFTRAFSGDVLILFRGWTLPVLAQILFLMLCAAGFLALPVSRKIAKVRWMHVWRVMVYSIGLLAVPVMMTCWNSMVFTRNMHWLEVFRALALLMLPVAVLLFWQAAVKRYLKMEHSWAVAFSILLIGGIATIAIVFYANNPMSPAEMLEQAGSLFGGG